MTKLSSFRFHDMGNNILHFGYFKDGPKHKKLFLQCYNKAEYHTSIRYPNNTKDLLTI